MDSARGFALCTGWGWGLLDTKFNFASRSKRSKCFHDNCVFGRLSLWPELYSQVVESGMKGMEKLEDRVCFQCFRLVSSRSGIYTGWCWIHLLLSLCHPSIHLQPSSRRDMPTEECQRCLSAPDAPLYTRCMQTSHVI